MFAVLLISWNHNTEDMIEKYDITVTSYDGHSAWKLKTVGSTACPGSKQRKHQNSTLLILLRGTHHLSLHNKRANNTNSVSMSRCHHDYLSMKPYVISLTLKHRETHGCVVSTVATDALVLKHQAISIHNPDYTFIALDQFHMKILHLWWTTLKNKVTFWKIDPVV